MVDLAQRLGWRYWHLSDSRKLVRRGELVPDPEAAGFPDLVLAHPRRGRLLFRELKSDTGRLRAKQREALEALEAAGADVAVWAPKDWDRVVADLRE